MPIPRILGESKVVEAPLAALFQLVAGRCLSRRQVDGSLASLVLLLSGASTASNWPSEEALGHQVSGSATHEETFGNAWNCPTQLEAATGSPVRWPSSLDDV